jgi:hypothetical protein
MHGASGIETRHDRKSRSLIVFCEDLSRTTDDVVVRDHQARLRDDEPRARRFLTVGVKHGEPEYRRISLTLQLGAREKSQVDEEG